MQERKGVNGKRQQKLLPFDSAKSVHKPLA